MTAQSSGEHVGEVLQTAGDDEIDARASDDEEGDLAAATPDAAMGRTADPAAQSSEGEPGRRRRRRRRGRSGNGPGAPGTDANVQRSSAQRAPSPARADDSRADEDDDDAQGGEAASGGNEPADANRRRRRRRGRRRGASESVAVQQHQVVVPPRPAGQDEIVVDIDESELQLVREQFGEIDELDDFTLKARRRGVLDTLAEEVELEDLTANDRAAPRAAAAAAAAAVAATKAAEDAEDDEGDEGDEGAQGDNEPEDGSEGSGTDDESRPKRRRRRRKKKKAEAAEPAAPPLMVPPHKDFWEVWATHFNYRDFEDPASTEPEPEPELEREPERERERQPRAPRADSFASDRSAATDDTWVNVRLSIGRSHAKKAADIRELLADRTGLTGKSVRNLTVGDRDSEFQVGSRAWARRARAFVGVVIDGVTAELTLLSPDPALAVPEVSDVVITPELAAPESGDSSDPVSAP